VTVAVRVENLGKQFRIGGKQEKYSTMRDALANTFTAPFRRVRNLLQGEASGASNLTEAFWALKDVSFDVQVGETIGIIGRNGAGKSTLLKILSRITEPTEGRARVFGRVGSLLEVGTGFHPELTGRENIYFNGAILGMSREEINRKFDEIVAFAEIEKFIDTPVKHYSSGMGLRLGFAVAAHLEPEILIVDEVLAVGDAAFKKKCLGKMSDVAHGGRTVLFVSHDMGAVQNLCSRTLLLQQGQIVESGPTGEVISAYLDNAETGAWSVESETNAHKDAQFSLKQVYVTQAGEKAAAYLDPCKPTEVHVLFEALEPIKNLLFGFDILSSDGIPLSRTYDMSLFEASPLEPDKYHRTLIFPENLFQSGQNYYLELLAGIHRIRWIRRNSPRLKLGFGIGRTTDVDYPAILQPLGNWQASKIIEREVTIQKI